MKTNVRNLSGTVAPTGRAAVLLDESTIKNSGLFASTGSFRIPTLTFLSGDALGKELPLLQQQLTLGRGDGCDVLIMDPSVSRKHVQLSCRKLIAKGERQGLRVVLRDLGSTNGTLVNYRKVRRAVLKPGDKICIGRVILKFELKDLADKNYFDEIYRLATTDSLTGLLNRAAITRVMQEEIVKRQRYPRRLSVILLDIDEFKRLNDTSGHLAGDRALQAVSSAVRKNLRRQDRGGRFGGDEFLIVLPETGLKGAATLAERIRRDFGESTVSDPALNSRVTASFGVASYPVHCTASESLIDRADSALYHAKAMGKNRIELWKKAESRTGGGE